MNRAPLTLNDIYKAMTDDERVAVGILEDDGTAPPEAINKVWQRRQTPRPAAKVQQLRPAASLRPRASQPAAETISEDVVALRFTAKHRDELRFCHSAGKWFRWDGVIWRSDGTGLAYSFARDLARELAKGEREPLVLAAGKAAFASAVEKHARTDRAHAVTGEAWDPDRMILGTPGGLVDLNTGLLGRPDPAAMVTKATAVAPSPSATCSLWRRFLEESTGGDAGMIRFLQQWAGYCLTGVTTEHALVFVFGDGGNGKSVFLNTLTGIMGDYATTAGMDTFTASRNDRHTTELARLRGARLVTASETEEGKPWAEARIKQITGGDKITARFMRQDDFEFTPQLKLTIIGNHKPVLQNVDEAMRRRFNIVPFTRRPERPDRELEAKLKAEWPAILRWMLEGCLDWRENGLVRPAGVRDATAEYFEDQDVLGQWLEEECEAEPGNPYKWDQSSTLFASWKGYAERAGEAAGDAKRFSERMQRQGFTKRATKTGKRFEGVCLKRGQVTGDAR